MRAPTAAVLLAMFSLAACATLPSEARGCGPLVVATWPFGKVGNDRALAVLAAGGTPLDAVEQGVCAVEALSPDGSVGLGGRPNAAGYVQLDACIMNGRNHGAGSVAGLEGIVHPISAARRVMEDTKHVMLVGEGARWFALSKGLETVDVEALAAQKQKAPQPEGHDTVALLVLGADGNLAGGCSTSGMAGKLPGRVGDSPILGSGLYVDNEVGAAGATGVGENIMRHCASRMIVERMRQGLHPQSACEEVVHEMAKKDPRGYALDVCFIALDKHGRFGAAASNATFPFAVAMPGSSEVKEVMAVTPRF